MEHDGQQCGLEFFARCVDTGVKGREEQEYADALIDTPEGLANVSSPVLGGQLVFAH